MLKIVLKSAMVFVLFAGLAAFVSCSNQPGASAKVVATEKWSAECEGSATDMAYFTLTKYDNGSISAAGSWTNTDTPYETIFDNNSSGS